MEWVETTGRTVEEAKESALDQLGVDESDAEFVILSEPRPGLFGRLRGEARVRARVVPTRPRPKRGRTRRQDERRSGGRAREAGGGAARPDDGRGGAAVVVVEASGGVEIGVEGTTGSANGTRQAASGSSAAAVVGGARRRRSRGRRRSGSGARSGTTGTAAAEERQDLAPRHAPEQQGDGEVFGARRPRAADGGKEEAVGEVLSVEEQGEAARAFVAGLVHELGLEAQVSVDVLDEETAEVSVDGQSLGILIGPGGATLGALQELARTVVQKHTGGRSDRILVDVAGYRARRAEALQRFTRKIAEEVLTSGAEQALEPMSAADRKVVHDTVNEMTGVGTRSEGEDPRRHIVIFPAPAASDGSIGN